MTKESITAGMEIPMPWAQLGDQYRFAALAMTEDKAEGHAAWREKRKPRFKGR
jgi:1,4-dihydroxy-2-naphthoyl-CoA synthase